MAVWKPKRVMEASEEDLAFGICVWQLPDGSYVQDGDGNHLSAQSWVGNPVMEEKMSRAAKSLGVKEGKPFWLPGFRKITQGEWEDQMERLLDGKVPDAVDIYRQEKNGKS